MMRNYLSTLTRSINAVNGEYAQFILDVPQRFGSPGLFSLGRDVDYPAHLLIFLGRLTTARHVYHPSRYQSQTCHTIQSSETLSPLLQDATAEIRSTQN